MMTNLSVKTNREFIKKVRTISECTKLRSNIKSWTGPKFVKKTLSNTYICVGGVEIF